jgi:hypothetical protein
MGGSRIRRETFVLLVAVGLSALLVSCGGSGGSAMTGSGGAVQIRVSATDGAALLSAVPAEALAPRGTGGATATTVSGGSDGSGGSNGPQLQSFEITFSSIAALDSGGVAVPITIALPPPIDLLPLRGGGTVELPVGFLPAGTYQGFVVTISAASLVLQDGTRITIEPPGDGWTTRISTAPFEVVDGQPTTVELTVRLGQALRWLRDHFEFHPDFDCHVGGQGHGHGHD